MCVGGDLFSVMCVGAGVFQALRASWRARLCCPTVADETHAEIKRIVCVFVYSSALIDS